MRRLGVSGRAVDDQGEEGWVGGGVQVKIGPFVEGQE